MPTDRPFVDQFSPPMRLTVWFVGFAIWSYLLVVPVDWLPPFLRFGTGPSPLLTWGKLGHALAFATLTALVPMATPQPNRRVWLWGLLSFHAFATEYIQTWVPTRTGQWMDVGIDHFGILMGFTLLYFVWSRKRKSPPVDAEQHAGRENQNADLLRHR
jgi:VanZ family protein